MHHFPWSIFYETCAYFFVGSLVFLMSVAIDQEAAISKQPFYSTTIDCLTSRLWF